VVKVRENVVDASRSRRWLPLAPELALVLAFLKLVTVMRLEGCCSRAAIHSWIATCRDNRRTLDRDPKASTIASCPVMT
jgi:hypothetical protein